VPPPTQYTYRTCSAIEALGEAQHINPVTTISPPHGDSQMKGRTIIRRHVSRSLIYIVWRGTRACIVFFMCLHTHIYGGASNFFSFDCSKCSFPHPMFTSCYSPNTKTTHMRLPHFCPLPREGDECVRVEGKGGNPLG
jgi:hypothetical protein